MDDAVYPVMRHEAKPWSPAGIALHNNRVNPHARLMKTLLRMRLLWMVIAALPALGAEITLESLLREMTDFAAVARWPEPEFTCKQASSYDRGTAAPDKPGWFANSDQNQFIRVETNQGRAEKVMLDAEGPGCIVRFWLTTDRNKKGTMRFYLDGAAEPALMFPAYDLLSGDLKIGPPFDERHDLSPHQGQWVNDEQLLCYWSHLRALPWCRSGRRPARC